jgi:hypothetical protein
MTPISEGREPGGVERQGDLGADHSKQRQADGVRDDKAAGRDADAPGDDKGCGHREQAADQISRVGQPEDFAVEQDVAQGAAAQAGRQTDDDCADQVHALVLGLQHGGDGIGRHGGHAHPVDQLGGVQGHQRLAHISWPCR